jgi:hypothetical protein
VERVPSDSLFELAQGDNPSFAGEDLLVTQQDGELRDSAFPEHEGGEEHQLHPSSRRPAPEEICQNRCGMSATHIPLPGSLDDATFSHPVGTQSQQRGAPELDAGARVQAPPLSDSGVAHRAALEDALRRVLAIVDESPETRWAREFVLDSSPLGVADLFTNQTALRRAESSEFLGTFVDIAGDYGGMFDSVTQSESMFVPAFSAGNLTVGMSVHRAVSSKGGSAALASANFESIDCFDHRSLPVTRPLGPRKCSIGRYVRDKRNHAMLFVISAKATAHGPPETVTLLYIRPLSMKKFESTTVLCHGAEFTNGNILDSVFFYVTTVESRFCPFCNAPPAVACCANFPYVGLVDPVEVSAYFKNISRERAEFLGTTTAVAIAPLGLSADSDPRVPAQKQYVSANLISRTRLKDYSIMDTRHSELAGILQLFAVQLSISDRSPAQSVMPRVDSTSNFSEWARREEHPERLGEVCFSTADASVHARDSSESGDVSLHVRNMDNLVRRNRSQGSGFVDHHQATSRNCSNPDPVVYPSMDNLGAIAVSEQELAGHAVVLSTVEHHGNEVVCTEAPDREMKRKLKNRRTAARSYSRKKERMVSLKNELNEASDRAAALRKQENDLRMGNMQLRKCIRTGAVDEDQALARLATKQGT